MIADLIGSCLLLLTWIWMGGSIINAYDRDMALILLLGAFLVALVPASVGGCLIALILRRLARQNQLTTRITLSIGVLVGAFSGYLTFLVFKLMESITLSYDLPMEIILAAFAVGFGIPAGSLHSWLLSHWLRKSARGHGL